jgi:hypothetical protein
MFAATAATTTPSLLLMARLTLPNAKLRRRALWTKVIASEVALRVSINQNFDLLAIIALVQRT